MRPGIAPTASNEYEQLGNTDWLRDRAAALRQEQHCGVLNVALLPGTTSETVDAVALSTVCRADHKRRAGVASAAGSGRDRVRSRTVTERVQAELQADERRMLATGIGSWGGVARGTDDIARVIGFSDLSALYDDGARLASA